LSPVAAQAIAAWPLLAAEILIFGTAVFALLIAPVPEAQTNGVARVLNPFWRTLALVALLAAPISLLTDTADMAGVSLRGAIALVPEVASQTHLGHVWLWTAPLIVALTIAAWAPGSPKLKPAILFALAAALLLLDSLMGHAIDKGSASVAVYFIHEVAAGVWVGGLCAFWLCSVRAKLGQDWIRQTAPRISRLAAWAVSISTLSGIYVAYQALGADLYRLVYASYGRTLMTKVGAVAVVVMIGGYNRYRVMPAIADGSAPDTLIRNVGVESSLLIAVLGLAALLANTPPAH
jgi:putative copper resistance protein D